MPKPYSQSIGIQDIYSGSVERVHAMIDLQTITENLAKAKEDVAFWEKARSIFLDPRIMGTQDRFEFSSPAKLSDQLPAATPLSRAVPRTYGELKRRVLASLPPWGDPPFTTAKLVEWMENSGYLFASKTPAVSVNDALMTLEDEGFAYIAQKNGLTRYWTKAEPKSPKPPEGGS